MKIITILGLRPQFTKASTLSRAFLEYNKTAPSNISKIIIHTGQHYDNSMSAVFFDELDTSDTRLQSWA